MWLCTGRQVLLGVGVPRHTCAQAARLPPGLPCGAVRAWADYQVIAMGLPVLPRWALLCGRWAALRGVGVRPVSPAAMLQVLTLTCTRALLLALARLFG